MTNIMWRNLIIQVCKFMLLFMLLDVSFPIDMTFSHFLLSGCVSNLCAPYPQFCWQEYSQFEV